MNIEQYLNYIAKQSGEHSDWCKGVIQKSFTDQRGTYVAHDYMDLADYNAYDAMLLAKIYFWGFLDGKKMAPRMTHFYEGHLWIVKTFDEWASDLRFKTDRAVREGLKRLAEKKLIIKERHKSPFHDGKTVTYVRQNWSEYAKLMKDLLTKIVSSEVTKIVSPEPTKIVSSEVTKNDSSEESKIVDPIYTYKTTKTTTNKTTKTTTTTTPTTTSLSSLSSTSQSGESLSDSDEPPIATAILDLFSADRARQLVLEHGYEKIYRACCYVAHANRDKPKDKHLSPRFVFGELNGAGNIPANYQPPEDYSGIYSSAIPEPILDADPAPEPQAVVETKPDPAPTRQPVIVEQSPEETNWSGVVQQVKLQQRSVFDAYLQNAKLRHVQHNTYVVEVRNEVARDVLQGRFYSLIKMLMSGLTNPDVAVRFCIPGEVVTIEPPQPDPEPEKPAKVETATPAKKPMPKTFRVAVVEPDEQPVTAEQMMAGRMLFQQMVSKLKSEPSAAPDNITDIVAPADDVSVSEDADTPVEIDAPTG